MEFKNVKLEFVFHYFGQKDMWSATISTSVRKDEKVFLSWQHYEKSISHQFCFHF